MKAEIRQIDLDKGVIRLKINEAEKAIAERAGKTVACHTITETLASLRAVGKE